VLSPNKIYTSEEARAALQGSGSPSAARQKLSRAVASGKLWRSEVIVLEHNRRLICDPRFLKSKSFGPQVRRILAKERRSLIRAAEALEKRKILLAFELARVLGAPFEDSGKEKYPVWKKEFQALEEGRCGVIEALGERLERMKAPKVKGDQATAIAIERCGELDVAQQMAAVVMQQLKNQNLIAWNDSPEIRRESYGVIFNNYVFSEASFTWLRPTNFRPTSKGTREAVPMVMDCYARRVELYDVEGFLVRLERAGEHNKKKQTFYGVLVGQHFSKDALNRAKREGLHLIHLGQMFGDDAMKLVQQYSELAQSVTGNMDRLDPKKFDLITDSLTDLKSSPIVKDLRSIGFEILASLLLRSENYANVKMNLNVPFLETTREIDATGKRMTEGTVVHRVVECKAHGARIDLTEEEVKKFFTETVPAALKHFGKEDDCLIEAELWTTGKISKETEEHLDKLKLSKKVTPKIRGLRSIKKLVPKELKPARKLLEAIAKGG